MLMIALQTSPAMATTHYVDSYGGGKWWLV